VATHAAAKSHLAAAIIGGWVLVAAVWAIFGFLSQNYLLYVPLLIAYAIWTVVSLLMFGRGLDNEAADEEAHSAH
jgi:multidrug transporter EmrE-like cation transporter